MHVKLADATKNAQTGRNMQGLASGEAVEKMDKILAHDVVDDEHNE